MDKYLIYCGGIFKSTANTLQVKNSFTNQFFAETFLAGKQDLEEAIIAAQKAEKQMKELPAYEKYKILKEIAEKLLADKIRLANILALEACKPVKNAIAEIERAAQTFIIAAEESKRIPAEFMQIDWTPAGKNKEAIIKYFPLGLIAGIAPFNFPLNLAVHKIAPAIAAGNPIILKPARSTPLSTLELARIADSTSLPKGALSILPMDRESGNLLVTDERFKLITFTGSPEVGWKMKRDAGKKKVVLELGGNAGVIVTETADIEIAVQKCIIGGFSYAGQICIHAQRIYVHKNIFDNFTSKFTEGVKKLNIGHPTNTETDISAMIDEENAIRVEQWVNEAVAQGAIILCGGQRDRAIYQPTILTNTKREMKVNCQEIFGPVVTLEKYDDFEQAVHEINNSEFGLQAGVFTNNIKEMNYAFANLEVGGVMLNEIPTFRVDHMPYGGVKNSGIGREGVKFAIAEMMEPRLLIKDIL